MFGDRIAASSQSVSNACNVIAISFICVLSFGLPFYHHDRLMRHVHALDRDVERASPPAFEEREIAAWQAIRLASGVICAVVGIPAFCSYYRYWPLEGKWAEIFLILSVVFAASSFGFSTILIASFESGDINELRSHISTWSTLFSLPNIGILWSIMSLLASTIAFTAEKVVFANPMDYFEMAVTIIMIVMGIAVTTLFYLVPGFTCHPLFFLLC
ncbi:hypothetical protein APHAL10511_006664 [Amanita phalloides]|nr:hypothetical protein APHAL10511_006664 [Amanita phalloides]